MGSALLETMTSQVTEECEGNRVAAQQEADAIKADAESKSAAQRNTVQAATDAEMERLFSEIATSVPCPYAEIQGYIFHSEGLSPEGIVEVMLAYKAIRMPPPSE